MGGKDLCGCFSRDILLIISYCMTTLFIDFFLLGIFIISLAYSTTMMEDARRTNDFEHKNGVCLIKRVIED